MGRSPEKTPSFMKIMLEDSSKKLMIPPKFVRLHRGTLDRKCILRPTGTQDSWPVGTKQINKLLYFKKGWEKFVQHHCLRFGDLLVFRYAQDHEFYVDMFDKSCCNKEPVTSRNVGSQKETTPILPNQGKKADLITLAIDPAEEFMASSEFPAFSKIVKSAYMKFGVYMPVDRVFAKKFLIDSTREVKIEVSGKTWSVGLALAGGFSCRLSRGWASLATENTLKAGDVCVFQLIDTEDFTLKLSIFSSTRSDKAVEAHFSQEVEAHPSQAAIESANRFLSQSKYPSYSSVLSR
ncbi:B3 domain-containing protein REM5-like [Apium graveolens]|uniref:B3 domain-containing protein REM5-like n=1 Tax=Apium graveolens TaxID=4045 RepID=UPI003D7904F9